MEIYFPRGFPKYCFGLTSYLYQGHKGVKNLGFHIWILAGFGIATACVLEF